MENRGVTVLPGRVNSLDTPSEKGFNMKICTFNFYQFLEGSISFFLQSARNPSNKNGTMF